MIVLLSSLFLIIGGCSNTNKLEGKKLYVFTLLPCPSDFQLEPNRFIIENDRKT